MDTVALSRSNSLASPSSSSPVLSQRQEPSQFPDVERIPEQDYVKRLENAYILFRRHYLDNHFRINDNNKADLSKTVSLEWKSLSAEERAQWHQLAVQRKKEHEKYYPHYVYRPRRGILKASLPNSPPDAPNFQQNEQDIPVPAQDSYREAEPRQASYRETGHRGNGILNVELENSRFRDVHGHVNSHNIVNTCTHSTLYHATTVGSSVALVAVDTYYHKKTLAQMEKNYLSMLAFHESSVYYRTVEYTGLLALLVLGLRVLFGRGLQ